MKKLLLSANQRPVLQEFKFPQITEKLTNLEFQKCMKNEMFDIIKLIIISSPSISLALIQYAKPSIY